MKLSEILEKKLATLKENELVFNDEVVELKEGLDLENGDLINVNFNNIQFVDGYINLRNNKLVNINFGKIRKITQYLDLSINNLRTIDFKEIQRIGEIYDCWVFGWQRIGQEYNRRNSRLDVSHNPLTDGNIYKRANEINCNFKFNNVFFDNNMMMISGSDYIIHSIEIIDNLKVIDCNLNMPFYDIRVFMVVDEKYCSEGKTKEEALKGFSKEPYLLISGGVCRAK
ncbi:MAG: hypothetical protein LBM99_01815 [Bacillales bacterium]|nr:hypothetical protein [Bacillales bacterium]